MKYWLHWLRAKRFSPREHLSWLLLLFFLIAIPAGWAAKLREKTVSWVAKAPAKLVAADELEEQFSASLIENWQLKQSVERLKALGTDQDHGQLQALLKAKVVYREPGLWGSSLWIDLGKQDHHDLYNAPIVVGDVLVGLIDYVGNRYSRVRLISDSGLQVAVRALRGPLSTQSILRDFQQLSSQLGALEEVPVAAQVKAEELLEELQKVDNSASNSYLAKGILHGSGHSLWSSLDTVLDGEGFNYDFADEFSPARDLRSGKVQNDPQSKAVPLLKQGDLLITSGLDGLFPASLRVAVVSKVEPLDSGAYTYNLKAKSLIDLNALHTLWVLPPSHFQQESQPQGSWELAM